MRQLLRKRRIRAGLISSRFSPGGTERGERFQLHPPPQQCQARAAFYEFRMISPCSTAHFSTAEFEPGAAATSSGKTPSHSPTASGPTLREFNPADSVS